ncbi:13431_t:CDS:2 [Gigaspora margarita]|uniref:13431_t:CDS:1 n=1 Tax=Gigaspora margarita TaxID=4874 RepID=A0ABN7UPD0_GIGMA|nr:13431_t:CDS:2 [Gigaspora margarita]
MSQIIWRDAIIPTQLMLESYQLYIMRKEWATDGPLEYCTKQIKEMVDNLRTVQLEKDGIRQQ